ncbi:hypothetical protein P879_11529 [Paragonimus westermani]|uniref:Integrase catalytic domain-containing protein n=1 Tax=Paragonimus westermani TaxID=34504 RepID=A0A8T0DHM9_9TREM|nr:hypothetical protein P879_11529 [Paragonimus westermani]
MEEQHPGVRSANIELDGKRINLQLDSEAGVSLVPRSCSPTALLSSTNLTFRMWNRNAVKPAGKFTATLRNPANGKQIQQVIFVVEAIDALDLVTFHCINAITTKLSHICEKYQGVFDGSLGSFPGICKLSIDPTVRPIVLPMRRLPFAIKDSFEKEISRLENLGVIRRVEVPTDWSVLVRLQKYDCDIIHTSGKDMVLADTLSRAPVPTCEDKGAKFDRVHLTLTELDERMSRIHEAFAEDEEMQKLMQQIREGWPDNTRSVEEIIRPYFKVRDELTTEDGLIFRGNRLVIPRPARRATLQELHRSHLGINGCIRRGKETVYWPGITSQVKDFVSNCDVCNQHGSRQPKEPMHRRTVPHRPWQHVTADLFSHADKTYLLVTDYFSDFFEFEKLNTTSSEEVISKLKSQVARYGIPERVRSDGGPQFASHQFADCANKWRSAHEISSHYHTQFNGKAESAVKEAKKIMKKCLAAKEDPYLALLEHKNTPSADVELSPVQRLFGRRTKTRIPLVEKALDPHQTPWTVTRQRLKKRVEGEALIYDRGSWELPQLAEGDSVWIQPLGAGTNTWQKGTVVRGAGERSCEALCTNQGLLRRKKVHLRKGSTSTLVNSSSLIENNRKHEFVSRNRKIPKVIQKTTKDVDDANIQERVTGRKPIKVKGVIFVSYILIRIKTLLRFILSCSEYIPLDTTT